jgi:hypothetical protein
MTMIRNPFNTGGNFADQGVGAGQSAMQGLNANPVTGIASQNGGQMMLNPQQQMDLAQKQAQSAAQDNFNNSAQSQAFGAQLGNASGNLNTQRQMAVAAQANAANNVANQLSNLQQARATNAQLVQGAMQGAAQLFR